MKTTPGDPPDDPPPGDDDEEPPEDVYFEGITRTNATGPHGHLHAAQGHVAVVARFFLEESPDRARSP